MSDSIKASQLGLATVDQLRRKKGWNKDAPAWLDTANEMLLPTGGSVSRSTLQRFWRGIAIRQEGFIAICQSVGVKDWQTISDTSDVSTSSRRDVLQNRASFYVYDDSTWVERVEIIASLLKISQGENRILVISGMTGIGKTALAERLISELCRDREFYRLSLDDGESTSDFMDGGRILLRMFEEEITLEDQQDKSSLLAHLLQILRTRPYLVQVDSLERLLKVSEDGFSEFQDEFWKTFFHQVLVGSGCESRLFITTQDVPGDLETIASRYPNLWHSQAIGGLSESEQLEMFEKRGLLFNDRTKDYLMRIGAIYEGHPLVLKVIAEDIKACGGDIEKYWIQEKFSEKEARTPIPFTRRQLQIEVKQRVKHSLRQLPEDSRLLLCRGSVYRQAVPEGFWFAMLPEHTDLERQTALSLLKSRGFVEEDWISDFFDIARVLPLRQHNLIRTVAYELLSSDTSSLNDAESIAAQSWITLCEPLLYTSNLSKVQKYIEAFHHFCEGQSFDTAKHVLLSGFFDEGATYNDESKQAIAVYRSERYCLIRPVRGENLVSLAWKLKSWGYYHELIELCKKMLKHSNNLDAFDVFQCLTHIGGSYESLGRFSEVINYKQQALDVSRQLDTRTEEGGSLINLAHAYKDLSHYSKAIELYTQGLDIVREIGNREYERNALIGLGNAYRRLNQFDSAIDLYEQALEINKGLPEGQRSDVALISLGNFYSEQGDYSRAIEYFHQRLLSLGGTSDGEPVAIALLNLGATYSAMDEDDTAIDYFHRCLDVATKVDARHLRVAALINLSGAYTKLDKDSAALNSLNTALNLVEAVNSPKMHFQVLFGLVRLHQSLGQTQSAEEYWNRARELLIKFPDLFQDFLDKLKQGEEK